MRYHETYSQEIKKIGRDDISKKIKVFFLSGRIEEYYHVPDDVFTEFMKAPARSKLNHLRTHITNQYKTNILAEG
ncbi:TPA: hypothetical protein DDW35_05275 [Candidatus Sumerlaeota bacterium]|jgi:hypothetical protein|nr:hypothetical protein [Candidatus Sumerlaeota bacterium]